jgi:hypothetical protein
LTPTRPDIVPYNLALLALMQTLPVMVAAFYLRWGHPWRKAEGRLLLLYWAATALPLVGLTKVGSSHNYWIEFAAASAVLAACGAWAMLARYKIAPSRLGVLAGAALLSIYLVAAVPAAGVSALPRPTSVRPTPLDAAAFAGVLDRVRSEPGDVLADPLDVVVLADRPIVLEPFIFSILYAEKQWDAGPLVASICAGRVGLLVLSYPIEAAASRSGYSYPVWPPPVLKALRETMELDREQAGLFLYVWHSGRSVPRAPDVLDRTCGAP